MSFYEDHAELTMGEQIAQMETNRKSDLKEIEEIIGNLEDLRETTGDIEFNEMLEVYGMLVSDYLELINDYTERDLKTFKKLEGLL